MPPAAIAVALGVSLATATIISSILVSIALTVITTVVGMLLQRKPKKNPLVMDDRTITVRQPLTPRQVVQGGARVGGTIFFLERSGSDVWIGVIWSGEEIKGIDSIYSDDEQIFINTDGSAFGTRNGEIECYHHLGSDDQEADEILKGNFPLLWTDDHRLRGRAHSIIQLVNLSGNWNNNVANFSASIRGGLRYDTRTGTTYYNNNAALAVLHLLIDPRYGYGKKVALQDIDVANFAAEANICDEEITLPGWGDAWTLSTTTTFTVNTSTNLIAFAGAGVEGWTTGTQINVISSGTLPAPLAVSTNYFVRRNFTFGFPPTVTRTLHPTLADAQNNTNIIDFTTTGTGTHTVISQNVRMSLTGDTVTFGGNAATDTITPDEFIWMPENATALTSVVMVLETTGAFAANLEEGVKYKWFPTSEQLFLWPDGVTPVTFTTGSTGTFTLRVLGYHQQISVGAIDDVEDTVDFGAADSIGPLYQGAAVRAHGSVMPVPLVAGEIYYIVLVRNPSFPGRYRMAASRADAMIGKYIDITDDSVASNVSFESVDLPQREMTGFGTGMVAEVYASSGATLPAPLTAGTEYYPIRTGHASFSLAATRADAFNGVAIQLTTTGTPAAAFNIRLLRETRYQADGVFDTDQDKGDVLRGLLSACAGKLIPPVGNDKWKLVVGAYRMPLIDLDEGDAVAGISLQARRPRRDAANTIKGTYAGPVNFDQPASLPVISNANYVAEDGGEELAIEVNLPFTASKFAGMRLLTIELERRRKQRTLRFPTTLEKGLQIELSDGVDVSWARFGWVNKSFEVSEWNFSMDNSGGDDELAVPKITLELIEMGPEIYG